VNTGANEETRRTRWRTLCSKQTGFAMRQKRLEKLVVAFDQIKVRLSPKRRRWFRDRFLCLAQQCKARQDLKSAETIIEQLANNAYKLPECKWHRSGEVDLMI
jgi:predicted O-linked N-acetylglucosamine transferase (SPINDLY family)